MYLTDLVDAAGIVKDALGGGGLTGVYMRYDSYVSGLFQRKSSGHCVPPFWILDFRFWILDLLEQSKI
jgi:hypothetical protein